MAREEWFENEINEMIKEVAGAKSESEIIDLFDVILTPREINDMARRLKIVKMIKEGKSYLEIQDTLRISSGVISRVSNNIGFGFRRSNLLILKQTVGANKSKKRTIKYKGAASIYKFLGN